MKTKVEELKKGDVVFDVTATSIKKYTYLCKHPNVSCYHIFIDSDTQVPVRLHDDKIKALLDSEIESYYDAMSLLADKMKKFADSIIEDLKKC